MGLFKLEHSKLAYRADFLVHGGGVLGLAALLLAASPRDDWAHAALWVLVGLASWTAIEYMLHRFVLHRLQPFRRWHEAHHRRPTALICAPTVLSVSLIVSLVFVPAWLLGDLWFGCALTLGLLSGYFGYAVTHHATHHWRASGAWLRERKRRHALHHHAQLPGCYGVTSSLWDRVFGSAGNARGRSPLGFPEGETYPEQNRQHQDEDHRQLVATQPLGSRIQVHCKAGS